MVVREEMVSSAVTFLTEPSVINAPLDKKVAFLQAKNLTQEEIDAALSRASAGSGGPQAGPPDQYSYAYQGQQVRGPYQQYPPQGYWQQQPPPTLPRRDWRDYFIMATVMGGLGYGLYSIAQRYIVPLIAPPTPPQLEQDKAAIDEAFGRAFALIEQVSNDTAELKASEDVRKEKLDTTLAEFETVIADLKTASRRRDDESRRITDEIDALKALIPEAMRSQKDATDGRLVELNTELKSLKTLVSNRLAASSGTMPPSSSVAARPLGVVPTNGATIGEGGLNGAADELAAAPHANGESGPDRAATGSPFGRTPGARGGIPAWQLAAAKKGVAESGTAVDAETGA